MTLSFLFVFLLTSPPSFILCFPLLCTIGSGFKLISFASLDCIIYSLTILQPCSCLKVVKISFHNGGKFRGNPLWSRFSSFKWTCCSFSIAPSFCKLTPTRHWLTGWRLSISWPSDAKPTPIVKRIAFLRLYCNDRYSWSHMYRHSCNNLQQPEPTN